MTNIYSQEDEFEYEGFSIFVEGNPDQYCGGFEFTVIDSSGIIKSGIAFSQQDAINEAKRWIDKSIDSPLPHQQPTLHPCHLQLHGIKHSVKVSFVGADIRE